MTNAGIGATFAITYTDHSSHRVTVTIGDATRMKIRFGATWAKEADAAEDATDFVTYLAWLASRHDDTRPPVDYEGFLDIVASVEEVDREPVTPFAAAQQNGSPQSSPSPPAPPPTPADGSTPTPVMQ